jgi:hypothetical protein
VVRTKETLGSLSMLLRSLDGTEIEKANNITDSVEMAKEALALDIKHGRCCSPNTTHRTACLSSNLLWLRVRPLYTLFSMCASAGGGGSCSQVAQLFSMCSLMAQLYPGTGVSVVAGEPIASVGTSSQCGELQHLVSWRIGFNVVQVRTCAYWGCCTAVEGC